MFFFDCSYVMIVHMCSRNIVISDSISVLVTMCSLMLSLDLGISRACKNKPFGNIIIQTLS